ncbi:phage shock envelope stress response protein PspM [Actinophytocola sp.]|uniref:phage shock envelope stress response protein PspM n=1 Tax=Actinophytocola sp. TaxID=1872138 RepID=UPI002D4D95CE|nr:hypothetical protein [Actinophytocola sp.]HYQ65226.1 hypothetical protein [Actinophytocola sp.]
MARHEQLPPPRRERVGFEFWVVILWTVWWAGLTLVFLLMAVSQWTGLDPARDYEAALGGVMIAAFTGCLTTGGVIWVRGSRASTKRAAPSPTFRPPDLASFPPTRIRVEKRHRLPRPGSAVRQPMRQLAMAESALAELLRQLTASAVLVGLVDDAWRTAADTAARLRAAAARIEAVEVAAEQLRTGERASLEDGVRDLLARVQQGLDAYRGLAAAAGRTLLASTPTLTGRELVEETDRLAGLAEALRDLSPS